MAKAVLERDLKQLRAKRQPPPQEPQPAAPPAPMAIDLESPKITAKEPVNGASAKSMSVNHAARPVAPFPNMGFEGPSPKVAPSPNLKTAPNPKEVKNQARPAVAAAAPGRPASAPPRKDAKPPASQVPRSSSVAAASQTPFSPPVAAKASLVQAAHKQAPAPTPANVPGPSAAMGGENLFTDMTFSLAPPPVSEAQTQKQPAQPQRRASQQQQPVAPMADIAEQPVGDASGAKQDLTTVSADMATMGTGMNFAGAGEDSNMADVDDKIDGLFDLGPGGMDNMELGYDLGNGDNSNFNDMYFPAGDSGGGAGEFDDAFFNLNG